MSRPSLSLQCHLSILLFLVTYEGSTVRAAEDRFAEVAHTHIVNTKKETTFLSIGDRRLSLEDDPSFIASYFAQRSVDPYLLDQIQSLLTTENAALGMELQRGELTLPLFKATQIPPNPTWAENPFHDDYWRFSFHSLLMVKHLIAAHHTTSDAVYLDRLSFLISDWIRDNMVINPPSSFSWSDHSTAMRLENLLYAFEWLRTHRPEPALLAELLFAIHLHSSILTDEHFYVLHTNHGLDQAHRLYWIAAALPEFCDAAPWRRVARARTLDELSFALASDGVQVENSPAYHYRHMGIMARIDRLFAAYDHASLLPMLGDKVTGAVAFAAYALKPDGLQPTLGDTQSTPALGWQTWFDAYSAVKGYSDLLYSLTGGRKGSRPSVSDRVFPESGYAVLRDEWKRGEEFKQTVQLLFRSGFLSTVHRHEDDLSLVLYGFGEDWLIDSGLYRYQEDDPLRGYTRSSRAHNLAIVDAVPQIRTADGLRKSHFDSFISSETNVSVSASHELFRGYHTRRTLDFFKPSHISIRDEILPTDHKGHTYRVLFHVPSDKEVIVDGTSVILRSRQTSKLLRIRPKSSELWTVSFESGLREPYLQGWVSSVYNKVEPSLCIVFSTVGPELKSTIELDFLDPGHATNPDAPSLNVRPASTSATKAAQRITAPKLTVPSGASGPEVRSSRYALVTVDVECRKNDPPDLQRRAIFGELNGHSYGLTRIFDFLARYNARGIFFVDFGMFYFAEPLLAETIASIHASGNDVALHLHWESLPKDLRDKPADVLRAATSYFLKATGEELKAYRGGAYLIDDPIADALRKSGIQLEFSYFKQRADNCSFYKRHLGNAFTPYEGFLAIPVTTMPNNPLLKLDLNWRTLDDLLLGVDSAAVPVLFLHSFSFLTPWNEERPGVAESLSGSRHRHPGDRRLTNADDTAQRIFESVLEHWKELGVRTLGLSEIEEKRDELIHITSAAEHQRLVQQVPNN